MDAPETPPSPSTQLITTRPPLRLSTALWFWSQIRKVVIFLIGSTIIGFGIVLLVLPGPGWLVIFGGLALLATEFAWARWALKYGKRRLKELMAMITPPSVTAPATTVVPAPDTLPAPVESATLHKVDIDIQFNGESPNHDRSDASQTAGVDARSDRRTDNRSGSRSG